MSISLILFFIHLSLHNLSMAKAGATLFSVIADV